MKFYKYLIAVAAVGLGLFGLSASAAILTGSQGGTGIGNATSGNVGQVLTVTSSSPFLTYSFSTPSSASSSFVTATNGVTSTVSGSTTTISLALNGSSTQQCNTGQGVNLLTSNGLIGCTLFQTSTTTINGVQGPTFTFSIVGTSTQSSITTSSANLFLNLLQYTSGTDISVSSNGVINFVNPGFLSSYNVSCVSGCTVATTTTSTAITVTGGTPAGSDTQIQYNNAGSFGAGSGLTFNSTTAVFNLATTSGSASSAIYQLDGKNVIVANTVGNSYFFGGSGSTNPTSIDNTGLGNNSLSAGVSLTGANNTGLGINALQKNTSGSNNTVAGQGGLSNLTTGSNNVAVGLLALSGDTTGSSTVAIGSGAGNSGSGALNNDVFVGTNTGGENGTTVISNATNLGFEAGFNEAGNGGVAIGNFAGSNATGSNLFYLGNIQQTSTGNDNSSSLLYGNFSGVAGTTTGQFLNVNGAFTVNATSTFNSGIKTPISGNSFIATDANGFLIATNTPVGGVSSFNTQTGAATYSVSCTSGCTVATSTTSTAITVSGGGSSNIASTTPYVVGNLVVVSSSEALATISSGTYYLTTNPLGYITTSTNNFGGLTNASITANSPITWSTTSTISCPTCSTATGSNPTATISTSTQNGSATTFMRSDGAPAFSQSLGYTFSTLGNTTSTGNIGASTVNASTSLTTNTLNVTSTATFKSTINTPLATNSFIATDGSGNLIVTSTPSGAFVTSTQVAFGNSLNAVSSNASFTYNATSSRLTLNAATSSVFIGANSNFGTTTYNLPTTTVILNTTGSIQAWQVPNGVSSITVNLLGAAGQGDGANLSGNGASVTGTIAVTAGQNIYYAVGSLPNNGIGGFPGGGNSTTSSPRAGGGMSWISFTNSSTPTGTVWQSQVLAVAGGGGGAAGGATTSGGTGGAGGPLGSSGSQPSSFNSAQCGPGTGATQSTGGTGGGGTTLAGTNGTQGQGGSNLAGGTGGGGGYFGGGGGGQWNGNCSAGAGGGSSFATSTMTAIASSSGVEASNGVISITYSGTITTQFSTSSAALYIGGHVFTGNQDALVPTVSACGTNPVVDGNDTAGNVVVGSGVVTSCKITFGQPFVNTPITTLGSYSTAVTTGIVSESTSTLTVGFSATLGGGSFNYINLDESD